MELGIVEIVPGLVRWTAPHPDWDPRVAPGSSGYWDQNVGSVLYEASDTVTLIDPLIPSGNRVEFLDWLDARVASRPVSILTTIRWHRRDREEVAERYRSTSGRAWNAVPPGVKQQSLRGAGEIMFWLPAVAALVPGDRLIAVGGRLQLCPESWLDDVRVDRQGLAELLRPLVELRLERVLVSHGEPVLRDGRAALKHAIDEVAGEAGAV